MKKVFLSIALFCVSLPAKSYNSNSGAYYVRSACNITGNDSSSNGQALKLFCNGSIEEIRNALDRNVFSPNFEIKVSENRFITPLLIATALEKNEVFFYLLSVGADPHKLGAFEISALHLSAELGNLEMTQELIRRKLNAYAIEQYSGLSPYARFVLPSHFKSLEVKRKQEMLKIFINGGADINWKDQQGQNLLYLVTKNLDDSHLNLVQDIIDFGADIENQPENQYRNTPLTTSLAQNNYQIFKLLLQKGANPNAGNILCSLVSKDGGKYSSFLTQELFKELLEAIFHSGYNQYKQNCEKGNESDKTPLMELASQQAYPFAIPYLVSKGVDINASIDGMTAFSYVCKVPYPYEKTYVMAQALIDNGIDIQTPSKNPILYCFKHNYRLTDFLIDSGAGLEVADKNGYTLLLKILMLSNNSYTPMVLKLIEKKADVNARGSTVGHFPLFFSARYSAAITEELIKAGANLNLQTVGDGFFYRGGETALIAAVKANAKDCVRVLVKAGASVDIIDGEGKKAVDHAKDEEMRALLRAP